MKFESFLVLAKKVFIISFLLISNNFFAQNISVESKIDSTEMFIGSQTKYTIEATFDAGKKIILPQFNDTIVNGLEIVEKLKPDTTLLNEGKRLVVSQSYMLTSFDSALYYLPAASVVCDGKTFSSNSLALKVYMVPVDTMNVDNIKGIKNNFSPAFVFWDWLLMIVYGLAIVLFVILIIYLYKRLKDNKPIIKKIHVEPKKLPHEEAELMINEIKDSKLSHSSDPKAYYTKLTDALRVYISRRFGFSAMEMTSSEIIDKLMESNDKESIQQLKTLFSTSDLVKFAKYSPMLNENDANLLSAVAFINKTKIDVPEGEREKPHDVIIEEPRSKKAKRLLQISIVVSAVILIIVLIALGLEIDEMFF